MRNKHYCLEISTGFIYEQTNLMCKVSHMVKRKNILCISLVLLSKHEILQHNINTSLLF